MRAAGTLLFASLVSVLSAAVTDTTREQQVESVFAELRALKPMRPGQSYTVKVDGADETGPKEKFLRRRAVPEISASGLASGCGDYAMVFIERIEAHGFESLMVDGAEVSSASLLSHFSGHAVIAIRPKTDTGDRAWWLVDSTNLKVLSRDWSPAETSYRAMNKVFWIGYCGPLARYPVANGSELKAFYTRTLATVPPGFLNQAIRRLKFTVHPSLVGSDGKFLNPRLDRFLKLQEGILQSYHIEPKHEVAILLTAGGEGSSSDIKRSPEGDWVAQIGLQSACSPSLLAHFEAAVNRGGN
jgi:hypothetical protein